MQLNALKLFFIFFIAMLSAAQVFAVAAPSSCRNVDLNRFMLAGQPADAPPDKIYKFTEIRAQLLRSIDNSQNTQCYADFYRQAVGEVGDYWGERLARAGCEVDNRGRITGSCPDAGEARRSVEFVANLDRELKTRIRTRLEESREARAAAAGASDRGPDCDQRRPAAASAADIRAATCCGTASGGGGVIRAVERGINYQTCLGKMRPTSQSFLSGSGLASCVGNAVKAALQQLWDNITAIFSLPGELWAARSQIWALITQPQARAQFARVLMQQFKSFFTDRVEAFKCYNEYEKAQYVCRMGGQLIATFATPSTIGSFLRLATQPAAAAMRAMSSMLSRSPGGGRIMAGIDRANRAARSAGDAGARAARAVDDASGGRISAAGQTAGRVGNAIGRPLSAPIERIARSIEGSATFQRLFVNSFRAEKAAMGDARPNLAVRPDVIEGEVLPPVSRAATPSDAPRLERGQVIEGEFRVVDERPVPAAGGAAEDVPRLPPPESRALTVIDDAPSARVPDSPVALPPPARTFSDGPSRAPPPLALPSPTPLPRLAAPDSNVPRLPAPPDVPRLPAPAATLSAGPTIPAGTAARVATPDSPTINLPDANARGATIPAGGSGGGAGFAANTADTRIPVGSARTADSADIPQGAFASRNLDSDATVRLPQQNAPARAVNDNIPRGNNSATRPAPAANNWAVESTGSTRPIYNPNATTIPRAGARNLDADATVRKPAQNQNDPIPESFWDDLAREFKREKEFTRRPTDAPLNQNQRAESQIRTTPVERLNGRPVAPEEQILGTQVRHIKPIGDDIRGVNDTFLVEFADGTRAVWKPHRDKWSSNYRAEVLAYELDRALGFNLVPPTVVRTINGEVGSMQLFMKSSRTALPDSNSIDKQHFFDYLIDNRDRHAGNYLIAPDGKVISIDNGLSFTGLGFNKKSLESRLRNLREFVKTDEGKQIVSNLRGKVNDADFRRQLADYLGDNDAAKVIDRMRYLIKIGDTFSDGR